MANQVHGSHKNGEKNYFKWGKGSWECCLKQEFKTLYWKYSGFLIGWVVTVNHPLTKSLPRINSSFFLLFVSNTEYALEGMMHQSFGHLIWRADSLDKTLNTGKYRRQKEKRMTEDGMVGWHHQLKGHEFEQAPGDGEVQESLAMLQSMRLQRVGHNWATEQQQIVAGHEPSPFCLLNSILMETSAY